MAAKQRLEVLYKHIFAAFRHTLGGHWLLKRETRTLASRLTLI
jgi:hypothetical protein